MAAHSGCLCSAQDDLDKAALYAAYIALGDAKAYVGGDMLTVNCYGFHRDYCHSVQKWGCPGSLSLPGDLFHHWGLSVIFFESGI